MFDEGQTIVGPFGVLSFPGPSFVDTYVLPTSVFGRTERENRLGEDGLKKRGCSNSTFRGKFVPPDLLRSSKIFGFEGKTMSLRVFFHTEQRDPTPTPILVFYLRDVW